MIAHFSWSPPTILFGQPSPSPLIKNNSFQKQQQFFWFVVEIVVACGFAIIIVIFSIFYVNKLKNKIIKDKQEQMVNQYKNDPQTPIRIFSPSHQGDYYEKKPNRKKRWKRKKIKPKKSNK